MGSGSCAVSGRVSAVGRKTGGELPPSGDRGNTTPTSITDAGDGRVVEDSDSRPRRIAAGEGATGARPGTAGSVNPRKRRANDLCSPRAPHKDYDEGDGAFGAPYPGRLTPVDTRSQWQIGATGGTIRAKTPGISGFLRPGTVGASVGFVTSAPPDRKAATASAHRGVLSSEPSKIPWLPAPSTDRTHAQKRSQRRHLHVPRGGNVLHLAADGKEHAEEGKQERRGATCRRGRPEKRQPEEGRAEEGRTEKGRTGKGGQERQTAGGGEGAEGAT